MVLNIHYVGMEHKEDRVTLTIQTGIDRDHVKYLIHKERMRGL